MASSARAYLSSLRENPYKRQLINTLMSFVIAAITITVGAFLVDDQNIIKSGNCDSSKVSDFRYWSGVISIVFGCLIILYVIYSFFRN